MTPGVPPRELRRFVLHTERKISPKAVAKLYARAEMLAKLPRSVQRWIVTHAGGDPYMGFVVEPYCLFLAYEIDDPAEASRRIATSEGLPCRSALSVASRAM